MTNMLINICKNIQNDDNKQQILPQVHCCLTVPEIFPYRKALNADVAFNEGYY